MNGMEDTEDEHNFSDDGFNALPDTALRELEHNAILSTQQAQPQSTKPLHNHTVRPQTTRIANPDSRPILQAPPNAARSNPLNESVLQNEFDDDSFEWIGDEGIATPVEEVQSFIPQRKPPGEMTQREQWRNQRFGHPSKAAQASVQPIQRPQHAIQQGRQSINGAYNGFKANSAVTPSQPPSASLAPSKNIEQEGLLARIEQLMKERDNLTAELQATKTQVVTQKGEIAIIRENKNKETKVMDRQMVAIKKSLQEELAKNKASMESLAERNSRMTSENAFLKHELAEETEKTKVLQLRLKDRPTEKAPSPTTTPRKEVANSIRDGFDDDEIMIVSPAKSARRSKPPTPSAAARRKRKADAQSPIKPLVLRFSGTPREDDTFVHADPIPLDKQALVVRKDRRTERHLRVIQKILNYTPRSSGKRLIEELTKYSFPSDSSQTLSGIVLDGAAKLAGVRIPADLLQIFLDLWSRSLRESHYDCIGLLLEIADYILDIDMCVIDKAVISSLLPILQDSISINAEIRFKHSPVFHMNQNVGRPTPQSALNQAIDSTSCLELLYKTACIISSDFPLIDHFWRILSTDFILMLLNPWQPIPDITLMFTLLSTSIFPTTFGNICSDEATQTKMENYILERVCYMLWETPKVDETLSPPSRSTIMGFRLAAMRLLSHLAITSSLPPHDDPSHHGSLLLATNVSAIARLVRALYDSVAVLYTYPDAHLTSLHSELINSGVRLLYHITTLHASHIDLGKKLTAVKGGIHKHRVVLTRLAFSEGWYVDRDVSDETVTMATAMLEESVTPDEAETLIEAFPGFMGRKRGRASGQQDIEDDEIEVDADGA